MFGKKIMFILLLPICEKMFHLEISIRLKLEVLLKENDLLENMTIISILVVLALCIILPCLHTWWTWVWFSAECSALDYAKSTFVVILVLGKQWSLFGQSKCLWPNLHQRFSMRSKLCSEINCCSLRHSIAFDNVSRMKAWKHLVNRKSFYLSFPDKLIFQLLK